MPSISGTVPDVPAALTRMPEVVLDAAPGTLLNLASCAEHDGKIALAWSRLKDARSLNLDGTLLRALGYDDLVVTEG